MLFELGVIILPISILCQQRTQTGLVLPQVWSTGDASSKQGELAVVTRARQRQPFLRMHTLCFAEYWYRRVPKFSPYGSVC